MNFAPNLANLEKPAEKTTKTGKAEKVAEQPAGTVADESKRRHKGNGVTETCPKRQRTAGSPLNVWDCLPFSYLPS